MTRNQKFWVALLLAALSGVAVATYARQGPRDADHALTAKDVHDQDHDDAAKAKADAHDHDDHDHGAKPSAQTHLPSGKTDGHDHEQHDDAHDDKPAGGAKPDATGHEHEHPHGEEKGEGHAHADEVTLTAEAVRANVGVEPVAARAMSATFVAPAQVAFDAEAMAHVGAPVAGRVKEMKVRVGEAVKKGDELLVVESPELGQAQSDYLQRRADLAVARASVEPAKQAAERARKLYDQNQGIALGEVQKREAELKAAEGGIATATSAAAAARNRLLLLGTSEADVKHLEDDGTLNPTFAIRAPIDGRVIEREVTLGELVSPDKEALFVLADTSKVWVLAEVPEARLDAVTVGAEARVRTAASKDAREGKVTYVGASLNPSTRTGRVRIELPNPDGKLRPGTFAHVEINTAAPDALKTLAVPEEAVQTVEGGPAVFVPVDGEANTFAKRAVAVGEAVDGWVPVTSGLKEGERVVVRGAFLLKADLGKSGAEGHSH